MYIRLTPRQHKLLKKVLPTVKLNAYEIDIFNEINSALDNPIDEKLNNFKHIAPQKSTEQQKREPGREPKKESNFIQAQKKVHKIEETERPKQEEVKNIEPQEQEIVEEVSSEENNKVMSIKDRLRGVSTSIQEEIEEQEIDQYETASDTDLDSAGPFGTIDRRRKAESS